MDRRRRPGARARGGELIPPLRPARTARLAAALAALALAATLGGLVAAGAGTSAGLAWSGAVVSVLVMAPALALGNSAPVPCSLALLAVLFLLDEHDSLVLAPIYAGGLLLVGELAQCSIELRGVTWLSPRSFAYRLSASLGLAALGVCVGAVAAGAATIGAGRSVAITAVGSLATVVALGTIVVLARRADRPPGDAASAVPDPRAPGAR